MTFAEWLVDEWLADDRNFARLMREAERHGYFESIPPGEDGKPRWRRTAKRMGEAGAAEIWAAVDGAEKLS